MFISRKWHNGSPWNNVLSKSPCNKEKWFEITCLSLCLSLLLILLEVCRGMEASHPHQCTRSLNPIIHDDLQVNAGEHDWLRKPCHLNCIVCSSNPLLTPQIVVLDQIGFRETGYKILVSRPSPFRLHCILNLTLKTILWGLTSFYASGNCMWVDHIKSKCKPGIGFDETLWRGRAFHSLSPHTQVVCWLSLSKRIGISIAYLTKKTFYSGSRR